MKCPKCNEGVMYFGFCSCCNYDATVRVDESDSKSHCDECTAVDQIGIDACCGCCGR